MTFKSRSTSQIARMICGNDDAEFFEYRSSSYLTRFFEDCDTDYQHDGSSRHAWVEHVLRQILAEPPVGPNMPPATFTCVVDVLMDPADAHNEGPERPGALAELNTALSREGFEAFYGTDRKCHVRHIATNTVGALQPNPHRPLSAAEIEKRDRLNAYLDLASEDELIADVLLPMFRSLGFERITASGHRDKALEYGKDVWMRFTLPTRHILYFGIQAKRGRLDSSGVTQSGNANIAEIHNQLIMMLGHELFDAEIGRRVLVDHAFLIAGGTITKAARNWLGERLDASKRSQVMFMDRDDILNLFVVANVPLPARA
jgi:hypothetical protein